MARNTKAGVRIAIGSDFDPKGFLAAEARTARLREMQLANSGTIAGSWVTAGQGLMTFGTQMQTVGRGMVDVGGSLTRNVTLPIVGIGGAAINASVEFESAFAGVRKTVEGTAEQMAALEQGIRDMAMEIPATREEIAGVAAAAGQLGIETDKVLGFTRVMIDLGESTNLSAEEGATALARFANITQMSQDQFSNLGSSIVALGNNMATTEAEIAEFGLRIAGAGEQIGLSEPQILAIGAALSSVGIEAEAGGTAISKTMIGIEAAVAGASMSAKDYATQFGVSMDDAKKAIKESGGQLEMWAKTAGMSADQFVAAWESDPATALNTVIQGLANMEAQGGSTLTQLEALGITEVRQRDALLRAAGAGDLLAKALQISGDAWTQNSALANEAAQRYATTESKLTILKNKVTDVGVTLGDSLAPALMDALEAAQPMLDTVRDLAQQFAELEPQQQQQIIKWAAIAATAGPALSILGHMTIGLGGLINVTGQTVVQLGKMRASLDAVRAAQTAATGAHTSYLGALLATPAGMVAVVAAGAILQKELAEWITGYEDLGAAAKASMDEDTEGWDRFRANAGLGVAGPLGLIARLGEGYSQLTADTEKAVGLQSEFGLVLDENGVPTAESIEALRKHNEATRAMADGTGMASQRLFALRDALTAVNSAEMEAEHADIALERSKIRLEEAQARYNEAVTENGPASKEAMEAELNLREATLNLEEAQIRASTAQGELNTAIANMPKPRPEDLQGWVEYYKAIGDMAGYAGAQANLAAAGTSGKMVGGGGTRQIPGASGGGWFTGPKSGYPVILHGEEVVVSMDDRSSVEQYLPVLLASLNATPVSASQPLAAPVHVPTPVAAGAGEFHLHIHGQKTSYASERRLLMDYKKGFLQ